MKNFLLGVMTTALCLVATGANYQAARPKNYEIKRFTLLDLNQIHRTEKLNHAALGGWRLISIEEREGDIDVYYFEREQR